MYLYVMYVYEVALNVFLPVSLNKRIMMQN